MEKIFDTGPDGSKISSSDYLRNDYVKKLENEFIKVMNLLLAKQSSTCENKGLCSKCDKINDSECLNEKIINAFKEYIKKFDRIPYHIITGKIYDMGNEEFEILSNRPHEIVNYLNYKYERESDNQIKEEIKVLIKLFMKIVDHINLAVNQKSQQMILKENAEKKSKDLVDAVEKAIGDKITLSLGRSEDSINKSVQEQIIKAKDHIATELISIVSIFVAIAFVMFGGLTLINNLFDYTGVNGVPIVEMLCLGSLIGLIIIDAIYGFIMMVFYLSSKEEAVKEQKFLKKLIHRLNIVLIAIILITGGLWWFDVKNTYGYKENASGCRVIEVDKNNNKYILECKGEEKLPKCGEIVNENEPTPCE